jgi:molybdate transport system permease protein
MRAASPVANSQSIFNRAMLGIGLLGLVLLTAPVATFLWRAFDARSSFEREETRDVLAEALILSLWSSAIALIVVVTLGTPLAWVLARHRTRSMRLLDALVDLPIILPPAVAGIALLTAFGRRGVFGEWLDSVGITVGFSTTAVIIAQVFVSAPFFVRTARSGFLRVERTLEEAAADLGATPWRVFCQVTLPLSRSSLIAGAVLAWARSLGEFGATIMFAGNREGVTQTMPLAIYERFGAGDLGAALVLSSVLMAISVIFLLSVRLLGEPGAPR